MSFFSSLFKKEQSVLGVDIGSSAIKIVQIKKKKGHAVLENYGELSLGPYAGMEIGRATNLPPDKLIQALKDIIRESKINANLCGVALPLSSSLISFISVPQVAEKQLADVVNLEARKYIPVPLNEVMLDFSVIPRQDVRTNAPGTEKKDGVELQRAQTQDVLVVAIHNEYINNYQAIMAGSALIPTFYEIEIFSSIRSVLDQGAGTSMIIDFGSRVTKLYIVERGLLRASHIINKGSQDVTLALSKALSQTVVEAEHLKRTYGLEGGPEYKEMKEIIVVNLDYIFYEANVTLQAYQKKYQKNIDRVVLTGGGALLKGFTGVAKASFQTEVVYANPFSKLEVLGFMTESLSKAGPEFAVAIGVALRRLEELQ